jgi:hypothetical protein
MRSIHTLEQIHKRHILEDRAVPRAPPPARDDRPAPATAPLRAEGPPWLLPGVGTWAAWDVGLWA